MDIGCRVRGSARRYLCICQGGNVRSAALATTLKQRHRQQALACGFERCTADTLDLLCDWADVIVVMMAQYAAVVPERCLAKVVICDVGEDGYHSPLHPTLVEHVTHWADAQVSTSTAPAK